MSVYGDAKRRGCVDVFARLRAVSDAGYVRLHRALLGHHAFRNDAEAMAFAWMIAKASWRPTKVRYKGKAITLKRGEMAVSQRDMATALDRDKAWIERLWKRLKVEAMIEARGEAGVSVITIRNYDIYQANSPEGEAAGKAVEPVDQRQRRGTEQGREEIISLLADANNSPGEAGDLPLFGGEEGGAEPGEPAMKYSAAYEAFYAAFPRKEGKGDGAKAYETVVRKLAKGDRKNAPRAHTKLLRAAQAFAALAEGLEKGFIKTPGPWLRAGRYEDDAIVTYLAKVDAGTIEPGSPTGRNWGKIGR